MRLEIKQGDVFEKLPEIESESIDLCITSPPYWGLRSYGAGEKELGAEPTMEAYLDNTMRWVKEVWRVLKPTGSFVLNIGDCFVGSGGGGTTKGGINPNNRENVPHKRNTWDALKGAGTRDWKANGTPTSGNPKLGGIYKTKQLLSVSSFAYCRIVSETDFVCRGEHVWLKPNVPSPIRSRLKHSHEKLFWFVKDADKYYFDHKAWMKPIKKSSKDRLENIDSYNIPNGEGVAIKWVERKKRSNDEMLRYMRLKSEKDSPHCDNINLSDTSCYRSGKGEDYLKNKDTIEHSWRIIPVGAKQSGFELAGRKASEHIAPYPEELIRPYIKSMCPQDGTILDPFLGSGTTMQVAMEEGRNCIGIELSEKYCAYAKQRLNWKAGIGIDYVEE